MARINIPAATLPRPQTHEGAIAHRINPKQQLKRTVMACLLWEDNFYEDGMTIAERIVSLSQIVEPTVVAEIAIEARDKMELRHVPLLLASILAKRGYKGTADLLNHIIQRADELSEFVAVHARVNGVEPSNVKKVLSAQIKRGLARAFTKFDEYQLAKYNRDGVVKLRDVLFLSHPKPKDETQKEVWKRLVDNQLAIPDTWETALSSGKDKKFTWERLIVEGKLGALAFLRNLRNMKEVGVPRDVIVEYMRHADFSRVLPFRFVAASQAAPGLEDIIEEGFFRCVSQADRFSGKTVVIVDVSGSMYGSGNISAKSDMSRVHAAGALAAILREVCENVVLYATAGNDETRVHKTQEVPSRRGMALVDVFAKQDFCYSLGAGGIFLVQCMAFVREREKTADRIIVLTDEQDCDHKLQPNQADTFGDRNYLINIASNKNGIGYGKWTHIDGWSEHVIDYIREFERVEE